MIDSLVCLSVKDVDFGIMFVWLLLEWRICSYCVMLFRGLSLCSGMIALCLLDSLQS